MGVKANSPAAQAFGRLFGDNSIIDLRGQKIDDILKNKDLSDGLQGAVLHQYIARVVKISPHL